MIAAVTIATRSSPRFTWKPQWRTTRERLKLSCALLRRGDVDLVHHPPVGDLLERDPPLVPLDACVLAANLRNVLRLPAAGGHRIGAGYRHLAVFEGEVLALQLIERLRQRLLVYARPDLAYGVHVESAER